MTTKFYDVTIEQSHLITVRVPAKLVKGPKDDPEVDVRKALVFAKTGELDSEPQFDIITVHPVPTAREIKKMKLADAKAKKAATKKNWIWSCYYDRGTGVDRETCHAGAKKPSTKAVALKAAARHLNNNWHGGGNAEIQQVDLRRWRKN